MIAPIVVAGVGAAGVAYRNFRRGGAANDAADAVEEDESVVVVADEEGDDAPSAVSSTTWKESAGRAEGRDGYVFGDLTRGAVVKLFGNGKKTEEEAAIEVAGDEQHTQVQRLVQQAVRLYRARGYTGTINMSHHVAYFTESASVSVKAEDGAVPSAADAAEAKLRFDTDGGQAGVVFSTLLARLERRAQSWQAVSGMEGLDPNLTSSAQIGFALPVIKLGWGVSVSLSVSTSSLLRWARIAAAAQSAAAADAVTDAAAAAAAADASTDADAATPLLPEQAPAKGEASTMAAA